VREGREFQASTIDADVTANLWRITNLQREVRAKA